MSEDEMSLTVATYEFEGPFSTIEELENKPGICVIIDNRDGKYNPLDVYTASDIRAKLEKIQDKPIWKEKGSGIIEFAVYYTNFRPVQQKTKHMEIEREIRDNYDTIIDKKKRKRKKSKRFENKDKER